MGSFLVVPQLQRLEVDFIMGNIRLMLYRVGPMLCLVSVPYLDYLLLAGYKVTLCYL